MTFEHYQTDFWKILVGPPGVEAQNDPTNPSKTVTVTVRQTPFHELNLFE